MFSNHEAISAIITRMQKLIANSADHKNLEKNLQNISSTYVVKYDDIVCLYNKLSVFYMDLEQAGGESAYLQSDVLWLQSELELLLECYRLFQELGASVATISLSLSKDKLNVFPKTKSQLQNTYYKLRNGQIPLETIYKQKPGRKRAHEAIVAIAPTEVEEQQDMNEESVQPECQMPRKKSLVQLLSGMIHNFQIICDHDTGSEQQLHQLIEGIYELSHMSAERMIMDEKIKALQAEMELLRSENEKLRGEKKELLGDVQRMTDRVHRFIDSSDLEQIRGLSHFIHTCRQELDKLGIYPNLSERNLKIVVNHTGHALSVSE